MDYTNLGVYVNRAMGLDIGNRFGSDFIEEYFVEGVKVNSTTDMSIKSMASWARSGKYHSGSEDTGYKQFTITPPRYAVLTSILEIMLLLSNGR